MKGVWGPLLVLIVLLSAVRGVATELTRLVDPAQPRIGLTDPVDIAFDEIRRGAARRDAGEGVIELLRTGGQFPSAAIVAAPEIQRRAGGFFTFNLDGEPDATASAMGTDWQQHIVHAYLSGVLPFETDNLWLPLQTLAQRKRYQYDHSQYWTRQDVWQTSAQALVSPRGDCEDHALALADWLISLGADARVVVGHHGNTGHAWVVMIHQDQEYLFEATQKDGLGRGRAYPLARLMTNYRPQFMFNRETFWTNTGSSWITHYRGEPWARKSRYIATGS